MRTKIVAVLVAGLLIAAAALPLVASGSTSSHKTAKQKPTIKTEEVGYFGNANVAHEVSVSCTRTASSCARTSARAPATM
jgi:hypothetical protein